MRIHLDFETRSKADIKKVGAWAYSRHPSTDVLCLAYCIDDGRVEGRHPANLMLDTPLLIPDEAIWVAHNAFFEQCIWNNIMVARYGWPPIRPEQWRCTAAKAAYMSLPRSLEGAGSALKLPIQKDKEGQKAMLKLCKPRRNGEFYEYDDAPDDFETLYAYCIQDVESERAIDLALPDLSVREQAIWALDQRINMRGVQVDVAGIERILTFIERTVADLTQEFIDITHGYVSSPSQVARFREWLAANGVILDDLQAASVDTVLDGDDIPLAVRRALEIRRALSKISTAKYNALLDRTDRADGRLRDILLYAAAITKRWGGRGVQLQNLPRGTVDSGVAIDLINANDYETFEQCYDNLMAVYSSCVRGYLIPSPGNELFVGDFSAIEAMVLPWLAGQEDTLAVFRDRRDIYCEEASGIFSRPITKRDKYERSVGKVAVLGLGFGGGIGAFGTMARAYHLDLSPAYETLWASGTVDERDKAGLAYKGYLSRVDEPLNEPSGLVADIIKQRWRRKNDRIVQYWYDLERAAVEAALTGKKVRVEGEDRPLLDVMFAMVKSDLVCRLPSGTCLVYPDARVAQEETPWGAVKNTLTYRTQNDRTFQYERIKTYGGKLAENITQAVARDLLADALLRLDKAGFEIAFHVHDEIVCDVPPTASLPLFAQLMAQVPDWAEGIPIAVEVWKGQRYRK